MGGSTGRPDRLLVGRSALVGVGAYAWSYLLTYATVLVATSSVFGDRAPAWKVAGWYLHAAHGGRLLERGVGAARSGRTTYDLLRVTDGGVNLLLVVPPLSVAIGGFLLAWWAGSRGLRRGALFGALLCLGYPLGTLVVAAGTVHVLGDPIVAVEYRPRVSPRVLLASVGYPVIAGALGGCVAGGLASRLGRPREG